MLPGKLNHRWSHCSCSLQLIFNSQSISTALKGVSSDGDDNSELSVILFGWRSRTGG
jgi:hypothetical protein